MKAYFSTNTYYWLSNWRRAVSRYLLTAFLIITFQLGMFIYLTTILNCCSSEKGSPIIIASRISNQLKAYDGSSSKPSIHGIIETHISPETIKTSNKPTENKVINQIAINNFQGFNNITGANHFIVPNIVHFIRFNLTEYSFVDYVCLKSAYKIQNPDYIYIHTDVGDQFEGKYWGWIQNNTKLKAKIRLIPIVVPTEIYGQELSKEWQLFHGSDISRARVLMQYGGIYLDNDAFVIKNLDKYRKYEIAINWDENDPMGTQVIIGHKDARFLKLWLESYKDNYISENWYYNAGERPTEEILSTRPEIIHRVKGQFGVAPLTSLKLYTDPKFNWRALDAIHLLINHRDYLDPEYEKIPTFDEKNITTYKFPFGEMVREIMMGP